MRQNLKYGLIYTPRKKEVRLFILKDYFRKLQTGCKDCQQISTSKEDIEVGYAVISDNDSNQSNFNSISTAGAKAVVPALDFIKTCDITNKFIIFLTRFSIES